MGDTGYRSGNENFDFFKTIQNPDSFFIVFAITGSSSVLVGRPIMRLMGITKENLNVVVYWVLFIIIGLIFYQLLLVFFGWLFGQFKFFWNFEKKMLKHFGLKRFIGE